MTALIISNEEMDDILTIVKSLEDAGLLIKGVSKTIKNKAKKQKGGFLIRYVIRYFTTNITANICTIQAYDYDLLILC